MKTPSGDDDNEIMMTKHDVMKMEKCNGSVRKENFIINFYDGPFIVASFLDLFKITKTDHYNSEILVMGALTISWHFHFAVLFTAFLI